MWQDMVLYWAWRGPTLKNGIPPTTKTIEYAEIVGPGRYLNGHNKGKPIRMKLAVTVFDNGVPKEVNRDELDMHRRNGSEILMPSNSLVTDA